MVLRKIVSGGQTGVDRGALEAAIEAGLAHGGWCPLGRRAEDGIIPRQYQLAESDSADYKVRTRRNVIDSDGTLILAPLPLAGGTELTAREAQELGKACLIVDMQSADPRAIRDWINRQAIGVLNVAGPRASAYRDGEAQTKALLLRVLERDA